MARSNPRLEPKSPQSIPGPIFSPVSVQDKWDPVPHDLRPVGETCVNTRMHASWKPPLREKGERGESQESNRTDHFLEAPGELCGTLMLKVRPAALTQHRSWLEAVSWVPPQTCQVRMLVHKFAMSLPSLLDTMTLVENVFLSLYLKSYVPANWALLITPTSLPWISKSTPPPSVLSTCALLQSQLSH